MENTVSYEFLEVMNNFRKLGIQHHSKTKVHMGELMMLRVIQCYTKKMDIKNIEEIGIKVGELSKRLGATMPATSKMLNVLERKGYIEKVPDAKDRRIVYIRLSEKGEKIVKGASNMLHLFTEHTIEKLGEEDARELLRLLRKLYQIITEDFKDISPDDERCE